MLSIMLFTAIKWIYCIYVIPKKTNIELNWSDINLVEFFYENYILLVADVSMLLFDRQSGVLASDESSTRISLPTVTRDTWLESRLLLRCGVGNRAVAAGSNNRYSLSNDDSFSEFDLSVSDIAVADDTETSLLFGTQETESKFCTFLVHNTSCS